MESDDPMINDPLIALECWLKMECGNSIHTCKGFSELADLPFLDVWSSMPPKDFNFLPSFHLIFTPKLNSGKFQLHLVTFNGKIIDSCEFDLADQDRGLLHLPRFVQVLSQGGLTLCKGFRCFEDPVNVPKSFDILSDFLDEKLVLRSQRCKFAVAADDGQVCANCKTVEAELISNYNFDQDDLHVKVEGIDNPLIECEESSSGFVSEGIFSEVKQDDQSKRRGRKRKRELLQDDFDEFDQDPTENQEHVKEEKSVDTDLTEPEAGSKFRPATKNCFLCQKIFESREDFKQHLVDNPECKKCVQEQNRRRKEEKRSMRSRRERKTEDTNPPFKEKCPICLDVYTLEKNYLYDKELHDKVLKDLDSPVTCPICSKCVEQRRFLNLHYDQEHSNNTGTWNSDKAMCCQCFSVMKRRSLKLHQRVKHEEKSSEKSFLCNVCGKQSSSKQIHELHLARKHGLARDGISSSLSQVCDQCGRSYISIDLLKQHISSMHRERQRTKCDDCNKTFYSKSALVTHRVCIHLKIHPFKCRMCKYKAGDLSGVYRHYENSHGFRGKRQDVIVDQEELRKIREICKFNYFGNIV